MLIINLIIACLLTSIAVIDSRKKIIPNQALVLLLITSGTKIFLLEGASTLTRRSVLLIALFIMCVVIGCIQMKKSGKDTMGGGDYKMIAIIGFMFGAKLLAVCLFLELFFEFTYRNILFPVKKNASLPMGTPFGIISIIMLIATSLHL